MSIIMKVFQENEIALKRFIKRFTSASHNVDDFVQETFLKGFAAELRMQINEPKAFLFKIAKNVVLTEVRKDARSPRGYLKDIDDISQILDENQATTEEWLDGRKKLILFSKAVAQLTPRCREAFLMRRIDNLQYKQIANRMDISVSAVEKHVTTGLLRCNKYLREQGYKPSEFGAAISVVQRTTKDEYKKMVKCDE